MLPGAAYQLGRPPCCVPPNRSPFVAPTADLDNNNFSGSLPSTFLFNNSYGFCGLGVPGNNLSGARWGGVLRGRDGVLGCAGMQPEVQPKLPRTPPPSTPGRRALPAAQPTTRLRRARLTQQLSPSVRRPNPILASISQISSADPPRQRAPLRPGESAQSHAARLRHAWQPNRAPPRRTAAG